jgi:hypothetical protein
VIGRRLGNTSEAMNPTTASVLETTVKQGLVHRKLKA